MHSGLRISHVEILIGVGKAINTDIEGHTPHFGTVNVGGKINLLSFASRVGVYEFEVPWEESTHVFSLC